MNLEVEQKFPVSDPARLEARLEELGGALKDSSLQVDRYYAHPCREFARTDEALRIRTVGEANYLTYKGPKLDPTTKTRREIEFPIDSGRAAAREADELLGALGFSLVAEVRKERRPFILHWQGRDVEVALDDVAGLGQFVELELSVPEAQMNEALSRIESLATALGLSGGERRSYLELLLERQGGG